MCRQDPQPVLIHVHGQFAVYARDDKPKVSPSSTKAPVEQHNIITSRTTQYHHNIMTRPLMRANAQWQMHPQPVLMARVPRHPPQIFSIFRLPLRLHLLHEMQRTGASAPNLLLFPCLELPSVIRHNNKTNKQQQNQKESFINRGQDRPLPTAVYQ